MSHRKLEYLNDNRIIYKRSPINDEGKKITWTEVAKLLSCSVRTIQRALTPELKQEKQILNEKI